MQKMTLKEVQQAELAILVYVDAICRQQAIPYSLTGGTLLGAAYRQGFAPYDDDIDICLLRQDYNRLRELLCQNKRFRFRDGVVDSEFTYTYGKIEDCTTLVREPLRTSLCLGVNIDVFPVDYFPTQWWAKKLYWPVVVLLQRLARWALFNTVKSPSPWLRLGKLCFYPLVRVIGYKQLRDLLLKWVTSFTCSDKTQQAVSAVCDNLENRQFPLQLFQEHTEVLFEGHLFQSVSAYRELLIILKGNPDTCSWQHKTARRHLFSAFYLDKEPPEP